MTEVQPTFENKGVKYLFSWKEHALAAQVSRIHANHERTTCQLLFTCTDPKANPHLLETRFNLTSSRTRSELAKDMATRYQREEIDWKKVLEYVAIKTLREFEKGDPVFEIYSTDDVAPLEYLIYPLLPVNKPTVIFGHPGSGKSQTAAILGIVMTLPWADNPLKLVAPKTPSYPLYLDYEADIDDLRRQLHYLAEGMDLGPIPMFYRRCTRPIADDVEAIRATIEERNSKCLIIDSVSLAAGGDLNSMDTATKYFRALRDLNITTLSLAHTSKDADMQRKTILGSILFEAGARSVWEIRAQEYEDQNHLDIALLQTKANLAKKAQPLGWRISYESDKTYVEWHDPRSVEEFVERMSVNQRILTALKQGKLSTQELIERLGVKDTLVRMGTKRLRDAKKIVGDSSGWGLIYEGKVS